MGGGEVEAQEFKEVDVADHCQYGLDGFRGDLHSSIKHLLIHAHNSSHPIHHNIPHR